MKSQCTCTQASNGNWVNCNSFMLAFSLRYAMLLIIIFVFNWMNLNFVAIVRWFSYSHIDICLHKETRSCLVTAETPVHFDSI